MAHVPSAEMEGAFMTYNPASHQGANKMFWFHFWGGTMSSFFIYSLWYQHLHSHAVMLLCVRVCVGVCV